ncbi:glutamyl-tRNA reductase [Sesbania bispinosa]|nr:glutamyl-tRNA reductase [Sesbania bispinosa]
MSRCGGKPPRWQKIKEIKSIEKHALTLGVGLSSTQKGKKRTLGSRVKDFPHKKGEGIKA